MMKEANRRSLSLILVGSLFFSGCASKKGLLQERPKASASREEKRDYALKLFRIGSELLFKDNVEALAKFKDAYEADPNFTAAYYNAGLANEMLGRKEAAIKNYGACLEHKKEESHCLINLVILQYGVGNKDAAAQIVATYLKEYPQAPFAHVAAAKLALAEGDLKEAEKEARAAIERDAANVEALYVMARVYYQQKRYAAARYVAKNALELAPSYGQLHLLLGHTYVAMGLLHDALDSYALSAELYPSEEALESYGLMLLRRGKVAEGLEVLKRVSELKPLEYRHHLHLGNAFMANKQFVEAQKAYLKAQKLNAADKDIAFNLGLLFYDFKPEGMSEIDRLKLAQSYFKTYLDQDGLSQERIQEVNGYNKKLAQKIETEELAAQAVPEEGGEDIEQGDKEATPAQ